MSPCKQAFPDPPKERLDRCVGDALTEQDVSFDLAQAFDLLRAEITKNCKSRLIFLTSPRLREALDHYLDYRVANDLGCAIDRARYRGLLPETKLLLTHRGSGYELVRKTRTLPDGRQEDYWAADALEARFRDLYRAAGLKTSSHAGRRTFASTMLRQGLDLERVALLLGHADVDMTARYIEVDKRRLRQMFEAAL